MSEEKNEVLPIMAEMVYFKRPGSQTEDCLPALPGVSRIDPRLFIDKRPLVDQSKALDQIRTLKAEIKFLQTKNKALNAAYDQWLIKTSWVQEEFSSGALNPAGLGQHLADVLTDLIKSLRAKLAEYAELRDADTERLGNVTEKLIKAEATPAYYAIHETLVAALETGLGAMVVHIPTEEVYAQPEPTFKLGDFVRKTKGSKWKGRVVGTYSTTLTPEGYAVESSTETGSVQIYPASALELFDPDQEG